MQKFPNKFFLILLVILCINCANASTYVSLAPSITEIIYALSAQNNLLGVSSACNYPREAKTKEIIGNNYFVNKEKIIRLNPDYILGIKSVQGINSNYLGKNIKNIQFDFENIEDIYSAVSKIGEITGKKEKAQKIVSDMKKNIKNLKKPEKSKKILYIVGTNPIITVGKKSYISNFIEIAGHENVTSDINSYYPNVSIEYLMKKKPDIIIVAGFVQDIDILKRNFKNSKIIVLKKDEEDIINRAGIRSFEAIKFFSKI